MYIPLFPLNILPLPGELVPLHIFEPRYRQLLEDAEADDLFFGILLRHPENEDRFGSLVKLERVIRRHRSGESDIIIKAFGLFRLTAMHPHHPGKLYPGGEVTPLDADEKYPVDAELGIRFADFQKEARSYPRFGDLSLFDIANAINLNVSERIKFLRLKAEGKARFLKSRLSYELQLTRASERSKDIFHLN